MTKGKPPGSNSGNTGAIYQEIGPKGGRHDNYTTVPENRPMPPTSSPGSTWVPISTTPHGKK